MYYPRLSASGASLAAMLWTLLAVTGQSAESLSERELAELQAQNRLLQQQVQQQQQQINELRERVDHLQPSEHPDRQSPTPETRPTQGRDGPPRTDSPGFQAARAIRVSGEAGLAYFSSTKAGAFPNAEFRIDDAKVFLEAPIWKNVYFFTGLELASREETENTIHIGELYADIEDLFVAARDRRLSARIGRFNIPFGEEYQDRSVMANPLISHSVADVWGIDEGVQVYGTFDRLQFNVAVQNGGSPTRRDFNQDKSVTVRLSTEPVRSLHLSASAHRTGKLDVKNDLSSEIWFGGEYLGPLGIPANTRTFQASLLQFDAAWHWAQGHVNAAVGAMRINDDRPAVDDLRRARYFSVELVQQITPSLYAATRYGEIRVPHGYPVVGLGDYGKFYYASPPTKSLQRLSLGFGYRFAEPLIWKIEYSWEEGKFITGESRPSAATFSTELGLKF